MDGLQVLLSNLLLSPFFLVISAMIGGLAEAYALILLGIRLYMKNRYRAIYYGIPFAIIAIWLLWSAAQAYPGPNLYIINITAMFVIYPMAVAAFLPLAYGLLRPRDCWWMPLVVATFIMFASFMLRYQDAQIPMAPGATPTYFDHLIKWATSTLEFMAYAAICYAVLAATIRIANHIKKSSIKGS